MITTLKKCEPGLNGGFSPNGQIAALVGALLISLVATALGMLVGAEALSSPVEFIVSISIIGFWVARSILYSVHCSKIAGTLAKERSIHWPLQQGQSSPAIFIRLLDFERRPLGPPDSSMRCVWPNHASETRGSPLATDAGPIRGLARNAGDSCPKYSR